jgi:Zn-dependent protease/predicted transcriptional regulator
MPEANSPRSGLRLFTLFDIEIRLDFSVLFIFGLIVYSLGSGVFPDWHPTWPVSTIWVTAFGAGILFFASLLAHELSHSLIARRYGIRVPRITLFLFGGVAEIEKEAETPAAEFNIAIAGPLMSLAIAMSCMIFVASALDRQSLEQVLANPELGMEALGPLLTISLWLGSVNFLLAVFNMVPGFPLDGGRVARAIVWRVTGDRMRATRFATTAGKYFGWMIMGIGLWELLALKSMGGLWLILIGWFLSHLATQSYAQEATQKLLAPLNVRDLMRTRFETVPVEMQINRFVDECLLRSNQLLWPVMEGHHCIGTVSLNEVMRLPVESRQGIGLRQILKSLADSGALDADMAAADAFTRLARMGDGAAPVIQGGEIVGLLRSSDILKWLAIKQPGSMSD